MGKRIIQQARGKGSLTYRVRKKAFMRKIKYPIGEGTATLRKLVHSPALSAPLAHLEVGGEMFYNAAFNGATEGQTIVIGGETVAEGNILALKNIPVATRIFNIERNPGDGGKMIRTAGSSAIIQKQLEHGKIAITMPNRNVIKLDENCRATIGVIAGDGRKQKPFVKAGRKFYKMRTRGKLYPRIRAIAANAVDHPFGTGRGGKGIKSKTAKRNAPPGRKVGHLRPKRTGKKR